MNLLQQNIDRYLTDHDFLRLLGDDDIGVLSDFVKNRAGINAFCQKFYGDAIPRVMICGINPGRFGAGMTGIPFVDFLSLSKLVLSIDRAESEISASFFFQVVRTFGAEAFFRTFLSVNRLIKRPAPRGDHPLEQEFFTARCEITPHCFICQSIRGRCPWVLLG